MDLTEFAAAVGSDGPVTITGLGTRGGPVHGVRTVVAPSLVTHWGDSGDVRLTGKFIVEESTLQRLVVFKKGETFSRKKLEQTSEYIQKLLGNFGYAFANVSPIPNVDRNKRIVDITKTDVSRFVLRMQEAGLAPSSAKAWLWKRSGCGGRSR